MVKQSVRYVQAGRCQSKGQNEKPGLGLPQQGLMKEQDWNFFTRCDDFSLQVSVFIALLLMYILAISKNPAEPQVTIHP